MIARRAALVAAAALGCSAAVRRPAGEGLPPQRVLGVEWRLPLVERGLLEASPQELAAPATDGERVFVGTRKGEIVAVGARSGEVVWRRSGGGPVRSTPLYVPEERLLFVGAGDGRLLALDPATGAERWAARPKGVPDSTPTWAGGTLLVTTSAEAVVAYEARSGQWRWQYEREPPDAFTIHGRASPLVAGDRVYAGFADGTLAALALGDGAAVWLRSLAAGREEFLDVDTTPVLAGDTLYAASYGGGLHALEPATGAVRWRHEVEGASTVVVADERLWFTAPITGLHVLDLEGRPLWSQALAEAGTLTRPVAAGPYLLFCGSASGLYVVDRARADLAEFFDPGQGISAPPLLDGGAVYLFSDLGFLYRMRMP